MIAVLAIATATGTAFAQPSGEKSGRPLFEDGIVYKEIDGRQLRLDLTRPDRPGPHPIAVGFHGGSWSAGSRKDPFVHLVGNYLGELGVAFASVEYRLLPEGQRMKPVEDAQAAMQYLRLHAEELGLQGDRMAVFGVSAGAHIASLASVVPDARDPFAAEPLRRQSTRPQLVISFFGPMDLADENAKVNWINRLVVMKYLGLKNIKTEENKVKAREVSPYHVVQKGAPPFLIIHGTHDSIVPYEQSDRMAKKLARLGVPSYLKSVKGDHGDFLVYLIRGQPTPGGESYDDARRFLETHWLQRR